MKEKKKESLCLKNSQSMKNSPISERKVTESKRKRLQRKLDDYPQKETHSFSSRKKLHFDKNQRSIWDIWGPERNKKET